MRFSVLLGMHQIVASAGGPCDQRRNQESAAQRNKGGKGLNIGPEQANKGGNGEQRGDGHGADTDGVNVVELAALELDPRR